MDLTFEKAIKLFGNNVTSYENYQNRVMMLEISNSLENKDLVDYLNIPKRRDSLFFIGITQGHLVYNLDYMSHKLLPNSVTVVLPEHIMQLVSVSNDFVGWVLILTRNYTDELAYMNKTSVVSYIELRKNPVNQFNEKEYQQLYDSFIYVRSKIRNTSHLFHAETIVLAVTMFMADLASTFLGKRENFTSPILSRKDEIFVDFQHLLREHCTKEHNVKFYADKLCITTQYLSAILKEQSGRSAMQWIQDALMIEAKSLLKTPHINIQRTAYELNFPDQSTFGKFFKKHAGISPKAFKKGGIQKAPTGKV